MGHNKKKILGGGVEEGGGLIYNQTKHGHLLKVSSA